MKFSEYPYLRPNLNEVKVDVNIAIEQMKSAQSVKEQKVAIDRIALLQNKIETMASLAFARASGNVYDEFYDQERNFWDENSPLFHELDVSFYKTLLGSKYLEELKTMFPPQFFVLAEFALKSFKPEIISMLQEENKLVSQYGKLKASAIIEFEGEKYSLSQITPLTQSSDRSIRERAMTAKMEYFTANEATFDSIYDQLVQIRTKIAHELGYKNFIELGYIRMLRSDYNASDVSVLREQILENVVPIASKLYARQSKRLGLDKLRYFDESYEFISGNAKPKGDEPWMVKHAQTMYSELSPETKEFFQFMVDHELLDLVARKGKETGGYCTYFPNYQSPFIFSNFNGTSGDVDVLTHEAGHAFQCYSSRHITTPGCVFPTSESAEIHSMSMEFFTWPWMNLFFQEEADKYRFSHLGAAIKFLPYGTIVDAFQHIVYEHPELTPAERKTAWRELERKFLPHKDYDGCDFLERGGWWFQQSHIFQTPFYYIDYVLAQVCALQFWSKMQKDYKGAWKDYLELCQVGGQFSFLKLVEIAKLISPFAKGSLKDTTYAINNWLEHVDDSAF